MIGVWLQQNWELLKRGRKVMLPISAPHPSRLGFHRPAMAEAAGQVADWVKPLPDGSRLHLHEYNNGVLVAHRDRIDPERGAFEAINHFFSESQTGKAALCTMGILTACAILKRSG